MTNIFERFPTDSMIFKNYQYQPYILTRGLRRCHVFGDVSRCDVRESGPQGNNGCYLIFHVKYSGVRNGRMTS